MFGRSSTAIAGAALTTLVAACSSSGGHQPGTAAPVAHNQAAHPAATAHSGGTAAGGCPLDAAKLHAALGHAWATDTTGGPCGFQVTDLGSATQSVSVFYDQVAPVVFRGSSGSKLVGVGDGASWETDPVENLVVKDGDTYFEVQPVVFGNPSGFDAKGLAIKVARSILAG
jgi:hypothetical protein